MIGVGTFKITPKARQYVNEVLNSERLSYGYFSKHFEKLMASAHDCRFGIFSNSGTSSLQVALSALKNRHGWHDGDEVIVPAVTFIATSNIVLQNNMKPVFVDVDPVFYELDPEKIEAAITPKTRCIIPVHLFGSPCDMVPIMAIAEKHGLKVIEDSCETMFARLNGKSVGSFGDIGCFSTYVAHILTTGVGGLSLTSDPDLAVQMRSLINHGRDSIYLNIDDDNEKSRQEMEMIIQRRFSFVQMGYSYRATEMEAAIGVSEFEIHEEMMRKRFANGLFFMEQLKPFADRLQLPTIRKGANHSFMMFPVVLKDQEKREMVNYLESCGVETRDMLPITNQPFYKKVLQLKEDDYPVAKWVNQSGFYFASHHNLSEIEKNYIVEVIGNYFSQRALKKEKSCLILMSKGQARSAQLMADAIPVSAFDELIFLEGSGKKEGTDFFQKKGFTVIAEKLGKGALLKKALSQTECENIIVMGTDGTDNPEDIYRLLILLQQGNDLAIASRFMQGGGRETHRPFSYRSIGNRLFSFLLSVLFFRNVSDCNNLFRGFRKSAVSKLSLHENGESIMFEITAKSLQRGLSLSECPTVERPGIRDRRRRNRLLSALAFSWILFKSIFSKRATRHE